MKHILTFLVENYHFALIKDKMGTSIVAQQLKCSLQCQHHRGDPLSIQLLSNDPRKVAEDGPSL